MKAEFGIFGRDITAYLDDELTAKSGRVFEICLSQMQPTHLCELRPSYFMEPVDYVSENHLDDDTDEIMRHAVVNDEGFYVHCSTAKTLPHELETCEYDEAHETEDDAFETFTDHYRGNPSFDPFSHELAEAS